MKIIDPSTGEPFNVDKTTLSERNARAYTTSIRRPDASFSVAANLSPHRLAGVLRACADGTNPEDFFILAEEMEERDLHYRAVLSTRKLSVASLPMTVEAASDDAKDVKLADDIRAIISSEHMPELAYDLLDGLGKGVGVCEILWDTSQTPWTPRNYAWVDPRFLKPDKDTLEQVLLLSDTHPDGEPLAPFNYIIHKPRTKSGLVWRNGLARLVAVMYMLKSYSVKDWWAFAEVYGIPVRIGKYGANATPGDIDTLISAIKSIASDAGAVIPNSMEVELIESTKGNSGPTLFEGMAAWCDKQISKAVLGQTMTTEDGASQSQATVHNEVRMDIVRWDARQLASTLNEYLVKPYVILNYGAQARYPVIKIDVTEPEDLKNLVEALVPLIDRGLKVQASTLMDRFGLPEPDADSDTLVPINSPTEPPLAVGLNRKHTQVALNRQSATPRDELDELMAQGLDEWQQLTAPILNPVLDAVAQADSYEAFLGSLGQLAGTLDSSELTAHLTQMCWQARALGDASHE